MRAVDAIGSGPKTATGSDPSIVTGLPESKCDAIGSGPKTATDHGRTAIETRTASDALDLLTASGKQSESENDGTSHESCPAESGLCDPSLFLDPKIGKHRRIENGSGPPKILPTHHVAERAVMSGERPPRKRRGQGASAANKQPPPPQLPKGLRRQRRARVHQTSDQTHFHSSCWTEVKREERKPHGAQHPGPSFGGVLGGGQLSPPPPPKIQVAPSKPQLAPLFPQAPRSNSS